MQYDSHNLVGIYGKNNAQFRVVDITRNWDGTQTRIHYVTRIPQWGAQRTKAKSNNCRMKKGSRKEANNTQRQFGWWGSIVINSTTEVIKRDPITPQTFLLLLKVTPDLFVTYFLARRWPLHAINFIVNPPRKKGKRWTTGSWVSPDDENDVCK